MFFASHVLRLKAGHYTILCNHLDSFRVGEYHLHFPACLQVPLTYFRIHMTFSFRSPPHGPPVTFAVLISLLVQKKLGRNSTLKIKLYHPL